MPQKLADKHKHVLRLIERDANKDGWATVSKALFPTLLAWSLTELMEFEEFEEGFRARLTKRGKDVLSAM